MTLPSAHAALRTHRDLALLWPVLAVVACIVLWTLAVQRADTEHKNARELALKEVAAYAEAYERYVTRSVAQIDQIMIQLKYIREHGHHDALIEAMEREGMFTDKMLVDVSVIGRDGRIESSTRRHERKLDLSGTRFFTRHRDNISTALLINTPPRELTGDGGTILFTRRLDDRDDAFDGVLIIAIDAAYFTSFIGTSTLGPGSMLALIGGDSELHIEQDSEGKIRLGRSACILPSDAPVWSPMHGVRWVPGRKGCADGGARLLSWHRSSAYPLIALVELSDAVAGQGAEARWIESRNHLLVVTVALSVLAVVASVLSLRAAKRQRAEDDVRMAYRTATESGNDGFYMVAPVRDRAGSIVDFRIVDCNERGAFFYGKTRSALIGSLVSQFDHGVYGAKLLANYSHAMAVGFYEDERQMPDDNRLNIRWGHRRIVRVGDGLAVTLQDISERKELQAQMERLANEDSLTGLRNRHWFQHCVPRALARAEADGRSAALLFIDLDEFKHVNDSHGHATGDRLLQIAADRLLAQLRPDDLVARFGGDEFVVLLCPFDSEHQVAAVASRIIQAFSKPFMVADMALVIGASIGISVFPRDGRDLATLIRHSDIAMYAGKNEGKRQYRFFDPAQSNKLKSSAQMRLYMLEAIEQHQFTLHYQPRVDTHTGLLLSMEALLRWTHPQLGVIQPDEFIPLAESSGLIVPIGAMVVDLACAQLAAWRAGGADPVPVSINVSPRQFLRSGVPQVLAGALERHGIESNLLEVEITESAMVGDQDKILTELAGIRALGIKLHVDDFGTGYSSLAQLQRLKMDVLKVDRAFTAELGRTREGAVFFQAIVSLAHSLGMAVVAEGVETREQLAILRSLKCDEVQGYLVSRPVPADAVTALLAKRYLLDEPSSA